jgi:lipopolysaccharide/colanic/teichoic acid biosynthesis glycosyltransferase
MPSVVASQDNGPLPRAIESALAEWLQTAAVDSSVKWHPPEQMARALYCERARTLRTGEPFSLLIFRWLEPDEDGEGLFRLRDSLSRRLRVIDQVGWLGGQQVGVLLPFADSRDARSILRDIVASYADTLPRLACDVYHCEAGTRDPSMPRARQIVGAARPRPAGLESVGARRSKPGAAAVDVSLQPVDALFRQRPEIWKRWIDVVGATAGLILGAPVMLLAMLLIRLVSPGPALFKQLRAGRGGVPFTIYKLRTMQPDAEARKHELQALNEQDGPAFKMTHDPRLIPVLGRILRTTSLDELPQLWNVLRGDMSLVGPRPLPIGEAAACELWQQQRLDVTPGMTGPWQVDGRSGTTFVQWMRQDLGYVRRRSLRRDLGLLARTVPAVVSRKGAR